jgi:methanethiol oxidase
LNRFRYLLGNSPTAASRWSVDKVITIPAEPAQADDLPPALQPFGAVPPLVSDIDLSVDDRWLYVSCWGTGELKQYDVSDPFHPRETASVHIGGIVRREPHPAAPGLPLGGGPQMVEISRDGRRIYVTNPLYAAWDEVFYPDGVGAWMAKLDADLSSGGLVPTSDSSRTATTFAAAGSTKSGSKAVTRPVTRTASPANWRCR